MVILGGLGFLLLWFMAFSAVTSLLIASGCCTILIVASAVWDPFEMVLDTIATIVLAVLGAIGAVFAAIFSIFDF
jgi:hypothetical protein